MIYKSNIISKLSTRLYTKDLVKKEKYISYVNKFKETEIEEYLLKNFVETFDVKISGQEVRAYGYELDMGMTIVITPIVIVVYLNRKPITIYDMYKESADINMIRYIIRNYLPKTNTDGFEDTVNKFVEIYEK